ncbi:MAG: hypothetical protein ACYC0V_20665 [Armatimonadota bacterium]
MNSAPGNKIPHPKSKSINFIRWLLAFECKWSSSPVGVSVYYELMRKSRLLPPPRGNGMMRYALFSMAGFDQSLIETAERDGIILISGDDLLDNSTSAPSNI